MSDSYDSDVLDRSSESQAEPEPQGSTPSGEPDDIKTSLDATGPSIDEITIDAPAPEDVLAREEAFADEVHVQAEVSPDETEDAAQPSLSDAERAALESLAAGDGAQSRQAQIILDWAEGLSVEEIASRVKLSANTVARNIRAFEARRMDAVSKAPAKPAGDSSAPATVRITVEDLCRQYDVDMRHATHVAELAHQLFALTLPLHQLDERYLDVIYVAGLLHNVAYASDPKKHHTRGRDILQATPLSNVSDADRAIIAAATAFHRKSWSLDRLQKEKSYVSLPASAQPVALWLAALLRIADGLDYSQSQSTSLTESMIGREVCLIGVKGPHDKIDRSRANTKADMWRAVTGISFSVGSRKDVRQALRRQVAHRPKPVRVAAGEVMSEAGRKLLHFHAQRMFYHEPGTRSGANSEAIHDMRVAVRRMSSALDVFGGAYRGKTRRWILRELKVMEDVLGGVRDLDVNIAQAETYLETLPEDARPDLEQLVADWRDLRENNQSRLLRYLDSSKYAEFAERMLTFCETQGAEVTNGSSSITVAHAVPAIIYIRYEAIRAYEPVIQEVPVATLHEVRAEAKRMRYVLEFFRDALGPEARDLIELFVRVQDHLGALQDADIASMLIQKYIKREVKRARQESEGGELVDISPRLYGINAYLDSRQNQIDSARKSFGPLWTEVVSAETRQMFARAVGVL